MREGPIIKELNPLVQSSQLMQVKKQDENDAKLLLQMCDSLTGAQVRPIKGLLFSTLTQRTTDRRGITFDSNLVDRLLSSTVAQRPGRSANIFSGFEITSTDNTSP